MRHEYTRTYLRNTCIPRTYVAYTHVCLHTYVAYTHVCLHTYVAYTHVCLHTYVAYTHVCLYTYVAYTHVCLHTYVAYTHVCLHTHTHTLRCAINSQNVSFEYLQIPFQKFRFYTDNRLRGGGGGVLGTVRWTAVCRED